MGDLSQAMGEGSPFCITFLHGMRSIARFAAIHRSAGVWIVTFSHGNGACGEQLRLIFTDKWDIIDKNAHKREIITKKQCIETAVKDRRNR